MKDNRGAGLIGVMVSIAILMIALTAAVSSFYSASRLTKEVNSLSIASNFAEGVMERTTALPFDQIITSEVTDRLPELPEVSCNVNVKPCGNGLKEVTVTCKWIEMKRERTTGFSTLIARGDAQ